MQTGDTIAAISSAVGPAARIIVRMSGPQSTEIASHFTALTGKTVSLHRLRFSGFAAVPAWLYHFCAPHSATGEDTIEFHLPGNPLLARMMLEELLRHGARSAEPGEFTARAYFNGKIDLSQAEGVAATIAAASDAELRSARQLSAGELSRRVQPQMDAIADTLALVEVGIDFSEEDVQFLSREQILSRIDAARDSLSSLLRNSTRLEKLSHVPQFVLVGHPNAGKSTLLNALAGEERAVVSPIAGTTRDALSMEIALPRGIVRLLDVAGIDQAIGSNNPIESQMRQRAFSVVETSDHVILVRDCTNDRPDPPLGRAVDLTVKTKVDLSPESRGGLRVSALTGIGMQQLREKLNELAFGTETAPALAINARHLQAIETAIEALDRAKRQAVDGAAELIAVELRDALDALGAILGQVTPDDVLGRIFSTFCIGK